MMNPAGSRKLLDGDSVMTIHAMPNAVAGPMEGMIQQGLEAMKQTLEKSDAP